MDAKKTIKKCGSFVLGMCLVLTLALSGLTGCGTASEETASKAGSEVTSGEESTAGTEAAQADANTASDMDVDKKEEVYVTADANGTPTKIEVESTLRHTEDGASIKDCTLLQDVANQEGTEKYTDDGNGNLTWENLGADITYKGTTEEALPVNVTVTYYLDGEEISPEELAGKSGKVKIRFDYENTLTDTVKVKDTDGNKKEKTVNVPFACITAMMLPKDQFSSIEVTNGKTMEMDDNVIVMGYALPGLSDSLKLEELDDDLDIDIPEYVEMEAETTDFELDFTATVVSNGLFQDLDTDDLKDVDDLVDSMDELQEASDKLVDGASELYDGADEFGTALKAYTDGVDQVNTGAESLAKALKQLNKQLGNVDTSGLGTMSFSLDSLETAYESAAKAEVKATLEASLASSGLSEEEQEAIIKAATENIELSQVTKAANESLSGMTTGLSELSTSLTALKKGVSSLSDGATQLSEGTEELSKNSSALNKGFASLKKGLKSLADGLDEFDEEGIDELADLAGDDLSDLVLRLKALKKADKNYQNYSGLADGAEGSVSFIIETAEIS